jgi:hypothetical protein
VNNESKSSGGLLSRSYHPTDKRAHNIYSSMFSDGSGLNSQINSISLKKSQINIPKRPASNASMANSEYNLMNSIETSQSSLRQAIMKVLKKKNNNYPDNNMTPLDSRFTKSLQIHSPGSKFSHR